MSERERKRVEERGRERIGEKERVPKSGNGVAIISD